MSKTLHRPAFRTVETTLSGDDFNTKNGVKKIIELLVKLNATTAAQEISSAYKCLFQIWRGPKKSFKLYVNLFEAAAFELRHLTGRTEHGEAEEMLAFTPLEGSQIQTPVSPHLKNCPRILKPPEKALVYLQRRKDLKPLRI